MISNLHPQSAYGWHILQLLAILRKRWMLVAFGILSGAAVAAAVHLLKSPKYEATAQLLVMRKNPRLAAKGFEANGEPEVRVTEDILATHMQMVRSRSIVDAALQENGLTELPSIVNNIQGEDKPCDYVIDNLTVTRGGTGQARTAHVLNLVLRSTSPDDAQRILTAIIEQYQSFLSTKFQDVNQEAASLIVKAQRELALELKEAEKNYELFRQQSSNLMWKSGATDTTNIHRVNYEEILREITELQLLQTDSSARLASVNQILEGRNADELSELERLALFDEKNLNRLSLLLTVQKGESESPTFQAEQPKRHAQARAEIENAAEMEMREKKLLTELGPQHSEIVALRSQMAALSKYMEKQKLDMKSKNVSPVSIDSKTLFNAYRQLLKNDLIAMEQRKEQLDALARETKLLASNMVADEIQVESLHREVQRKQLLFDAAVDRLRDINLAKEYGGFINEVLAEPQPGRQVAPRLSFSLAFGALLATIFSTLGVSIAEYRDRRFRTTEEIRRILQTKILGRIPLSPGATGGQGSLFGQRSDNATASSPGILQQDSPHQTHFGRSELHSCSLNEKSPARFFASQVLTRAMANRRWQEIWR